ncbi:MAG: tripartite tricarboxylate transporter TctB family protein [Burkholderiales bacterium]|nr:tripartite tricarboxylate transporter TctB family protein [Burkholderiales bacterium]
MQSLIRNKDFWTGVLFIAVGLASVIIARDYTMGTATRMGPAYFPSILGGLLAVIGLIALVRSFFRSTELIRGFAVKPLFLVVVPTILFGALIRPAGLVIATITLVVVSALASSKFRLGPTVILALGMAVFTALIFVKGLGLPIALFGSWFGG